ncbi:prepilin-type N-terminal cleavage/methylation domain-containing protein [Halomonas sp. 18H]|jgi:type IV pilus assembly protein PilV|uniref:type IV pilus modification PilV family protein n=1 Tax=unclassified Halomonas TaxID=2609666 RepID=UPI000A2864DF|nr:MULTISPECIES: prepilin-type N-terminal cleavage/methylation domain-containing protein [unclassified Halomonas]MCW4150601.1 prepilin-type N-terminal cleavage/methylation domain-containing protein [Halomonas sp. 18H]
MMQRGFSLVEALIALLVLSLGLVGVAAMQLKALQSATQGYQRSVASVAAVDAQERLWGRLAMLEPSETCADINVDAVEQAWANHWFQNNDNTPLRNVIKSDSHITNGNGEDRCRFTVILALSEDDNDQFDYTFRLPELEVQ